MGALLRLPYVAARPALAGCCPGGALLPRLATDRDHPTEVGPDEYPAVDYGGEAGRADYLDAPQLAPGAGVERPDESILAGDVHDVADDRRERRNPTADATATRVPAVLADLVEPAKATALEKLGEGGRAGDQHRDEVVTAEGGANRSVNGDRLGASRLASYGGPTPTVCLSRRSQRAERGPTGDDSSAAYLVRPTRHYGWIVREAHGSDTPVPSSRSCLPPGKRRARVPDD